MAPNQWSGTKILLQQKNPIHQHLNWRTCNEPQNSKGPFIYYVTQLGGRGLVLVLRSVISLDNMQKFALRKGRGGKKLAKLCYLIYEQPLKGWEPLYWLTKHAKQNKKLESGFEMKTFGPCTWGFNWNKLKGKNVQNV